MSRIARSCMMIPLVLILTLLYGAIPAQSQTSQDLLRQYVADLQKSPNDYALREKIIKHVQTMRQKPAIPEEAERYMARGAAAVKGAKSQGDFQDAAAEFEKSSLAAPWLPAVYYNLGITQDKAGKYREAIQSLKLYLLAAPDASDAKAVKNLTYEIEYRQEKAARDASLQSAPAPKQNTFDDLLRKIDGRRYIQAAGQAILSVLDVRGGVIVRGYIDNGRYHPWTGDAARVEIKGRETTVPIRDQPTTFKVRSVSMDFIISEDGDRIAARTHFSDGDVREYMHFWQR